MSRRFLLLFFIAMLVLFSVSLFAKANNNSEISRASALMPVKVNLFDNGVEENNNFLSGKIYLGPSNALAFAPTRQIHGGETTQRDRQHYTTMGRQIVYAGYYNASCDYVYMDYTDRSVVGSTTIYTCNYAVYDWGLGMWEITNGAASTPVSPSPSNTVNIDATLDNGSAVVSYHHGADENSPYYTVLGYNDVSCPSYAFTADTLLGPPNIENVVSGYCPEENSNDNPYIWPHIDVDTNAAGIVVTHVASTEWSGCDDIPADGIELSSFVYWRKVATTIDQPWTGTWDGPHFIDSGYAIGPIVRADKNSSDVYCCWMKPMYYYTGPSHPCEANGLGHYQFTHEVVYRYSNDDGASWGGTQYVTDFASGFADGNTEPAGYELSALVDPFGNLHLVWPSGNRDPENKCSVYYASKMWHWDSGNDCISVAYDASHPSLFVGDVGSWNGTLAKQNISWCDDKLYISFTRFGGNPVGDTSFDYGVGDGTNFYQNGEIFVVGSDVTGNTGKTWTEGINLTQTPSDSCEADDCFSEHWSSMAMYSTDSLMIEYIEDKDPGAWGSNDEGASMTDNPIMFMTWPCFSMADVGTNVCLTLTPNDPTYPEIALAPNGNTSGCTTEATYIDEVMMQNCGNVELNYTTSSDAAWLTATDGGSGTISAGAGPRGADHVSWSGAVGCASPATIEWTANSATLGSGNYVGAITVGLDQGDDFDIVVNLVVACQYYLPEYATLTSGCWEVDVWNTPTAGNGSDVDRDNHGDMMFYACGGDSTIHPMYNEAFIVGWIDGGDTICYGDNMGEEFEAGMRALSGVDVSSVGNPSGGSGYWKAMGYWCTPDSIVYGKTEYFVPGHQDTAVLIEKITFWNESGSNLNDFLAGEGIDWDVRTDSNYDEGGVDYERDMIYQRGANNPDFDSVVAGLSPYYGHDVNFGAAILDNHDFIYDYSGYKPDTIYEKLTGLDGTIEIFSDSVTDLNSVFRFYEGTLGTDDTLIFIKIKGVSLDGVTGLNTQIDKGVEFIGSYSGIYEGEIDNDASDPVALNHYLSSKGTAAVDVNLMDSNGKKLKWTAVIDDGGEGWLEVSLLEGFTPSTLTVDYNATVAEGLGVGTYNGTITITAPAATNSPIVINVQLTVSEAPTCQGRCGDANGDVDVNVSDAVWIINYVFVGGDPPVPILACGDANTDAAVNVSDAVWIINYVFVGGDPPGDCSPGAWGGEDCCIF
jgi:Dockerin type I domain